jgi:hypothetical protein
MKRKRAPGAGRKPGELGLKGATLSLRLPGNMRVALAAAATRNRRRSVSEEIVFRLHSTLVHDRAEADRPSHIRALSEAVARIALGLERRTERLWIEDRYTAEQLSKGVDLLLYTYSRGEAVVPPAVTAEAEARVSADAREHYVTHLGESEAGGVISSLKATPEPLEGSWPDVHYPESWWALWKIERDLTQKPRGKK